MEGYDYGEEPPAPVGTPKADHDGLRRRDSVAESDPRRPDNPLPIVNSVLSVGGTDFYVQAAQQKVSSNTREMKLLDSQAVSEEDALLSCNKEGVQLSDALDSKNREFALEQRKDKKEATDHAESLPAVELEIDLLEHKMKRCQSNIRMIRRRSDQTEEVQGTLSYEPAEPSFSKKWFLGIPVSCDFTAISFQTVHQLTGIQKLSTLSKIARDSIVEFSSWIGGGPDGRGFDRNPFFLDNCRNNAGNEEFMRFCSPSSGVLFQTKKKNLSKFFIVMRLALYLNLEMDVELAHDCSIVGLRSRKRAATVDEPSTDVLTNGPPPKRRRVFVDQSQRDQPIIVTTPERPPRPHGRAPGSGRSPGSGRRGSANRGVASTPRALNREAETLAFLRDEWNLAQNRKAYYVDLLQTTEARMVARLQAKEEWTFSIQTRKNVVEERRSSHQEHLDEIEDRKEMLFHETEIYRNTIRAHTFRNARATSQLSVGLRQMYEDEQESLERENADAPWYMKIPKEIDFSVASDKFIQNKTGIVQLSQLAAMDAESVVAFGQWTKERGYDRNREFLGKSTTMKDDMEWIQFCAPTEGFDMERSNRSKLFLVMRLALYLGLDLDVHLNYACEIVSDRD